MKNEILNLYPQEIWKRFHDLTRIPRPSKKLDKISEFIIGFANNLGLESEKDSFGNIVIRKPASEGMENKKSVALQAHLDMVPEKNSNKTHDFEKDPIETRVEGEWMKANETTLGADNGVGVAAALAVLESKEIKHGPIEALFTLDEEIGLVGASNLDKGLINSEIMINLDTEDWGEIYVGGAGGADTIVEFKYDKEEIPENYEIFEVNVSGLKGGHSGAEIHLPRANANKILIEFLLESQSYGLKVAKINGGNLMNAIPREASAVIGIPNNEKDNLLEFQEEFRNKVLERFPEESFSIDSVKSEKPKHFLDKKSQRSILNSLYRVPHGVINFSPEADVVETSNNLATIKTEEGKVVAGTSQRSASDKIRDSIGEYIRKLFEHEGGEVTHTGYYPSWEPNTDSEMLEKSKEIYKNKFSEEPKVKVIHGGLECGPIYNKYPHLDIISFGPTIKNPHSPDEMVEINSVGKFWDFLKEVLENVPEKE